MTTYILLINWTDQGIRNVRDSAKRLDAAKKLLTSVGGSINQFYLTMGGRTGCFLPQVARETGWSKEQLLGRLCQEKLGLAAIAWKHPEARLFTFTALIIGPEAFEPRG